MSESTPEVRFEGFEGEWGALYLKKLMDFSNGINAPKENYGKGTKMISVMDILAKERITYDSIRNSVEVNSDIENRNKVENGDLVFVRSSEVVDEVGWAKAYLEDKFALFSGFSIRGKKKADFDSLFVQLSINAKNRDQIERKAGGSTRFNVNQSILNSVSILGPSILEQNKISEFYQRLDSDITLRQRELTKLTQFKQAMLQKMFPKEGETVPEVRFEGFEGEWESAKLKDLFIKGGSGGTPNTGNKAYYNGDIPFLSISDISKSSGIITKTEKNITQYGLNNSAAYIVPKGSVSLAMYASVGKVAKLGIDVATSQAFYNMEFESEDLSNYIYFYLKKMESENSWEKLVSTGTQSNLNAEKVKTAKVDIPALDEMRKLNLFFGSLNNKIHLETENLTKLKQFKQAMLDKMFV